MWTGIEQPDRQQMTIWHKRIVRWIPKATNTISEYAILIAFLLQKSLHARASKSRDTHISCLFSLCINSQVQWALVLTLRLLMQVLLMLLILLMQVSSLRPLTCWDRGFESHRGHGYLSVVSVVCCQVEVSATGWSLVQRSPTDCGASLCLI